MSGKETMAVANIAEYHVMVILNPKRSRTLDPTGPIGPTVFKRKKPTTVGGRTIGRVSRQSSTPLITRGVFAI